MIVINLQFVQLFLIGIDSLTLLYQDVYLLVGL